MNVKNKPKNKLAFLGFGYVAKHFYETFASDFEFQVISRSQPQQKNINWQNINENFTVETDVSHILISIPPHHLEQNVFAKLSEQISNLPRLVWLGYLSATSVYGDHNGGWVDENSVLLAKSKIGKERIKSEQLWQSLTQLNKINIFRLAGIYGYKRSIVDRLAKNLIKNKIIKPNHFFSRIHVTDIINILMASMHAAENSQIYNLADDHPAPSHILIDFACQLINKPSLPTVSFDEADLSAMAKAFYMDNKKINNKKVKINLQYNFIFKSYQEGLSYIAKQSLKTN